MGKPMDRKHEHQQRALRTLMPGVRIRITRSPRGLFDEGVEIVIDSVDATDGWVEYHYPDGFVWSDPRSGDRYPMSEMFGGGITGLESFCDPEYLEWEVVPN